MTTATVTQIKPVASTAKTTRPVRATAAQKSAVQREAKAKRIMTRLAIAGASVVWLMDLYASYFHITELAVRHGQSQSIAHMLPLSVDGLMLIAAVAVVALRGAWMPKVMFLIGAGATVAANIASVSGNDIVGYVIAGWVAVSLIGSAELLLRLCLPAPRKARKASPRKR